MKTVTIKKTLRYLSMFYITFVLIKCKQMEPITTTKNSVMYTQDKELDSLFNTAMQEAENPTPKKIIYNLDPIEGNKNLIDTLINNERYVKMVSWKSDPTYFPSSVSKKYSTDKYNIWVTIAPILKDSCARYYKTHKNPDLRLRQLLGLQPRTPETFFLEVWVKPADLFRPCPDNGTADTQCELNMPNTITPEYRKWFNDLRANQYTDCTDLEFHEYGYPWTQLGYTYDWSSENPSHVGLSEFVIKKYTNIYISGKYPTNNYCSNSY